MTMIPEKNSQARKVAKEVLDMLRSEYRRTHSASFSQLDNGRLLQRLLTLCTAAADVLAQDAVLLRLKSPIYVMGDIHGNIHDLEFFLSKLIAFDQLEYTANSFLFLGDYVDRGEASIPVAAILLALKCVSPGTLFLLRGNHETAQQNGNIQMYGSGSFKAQCLTRFGQQNGELLWQAFNHAFVQLPLAATIDGKIFCVHGGIPRVVPSNSGTDVRMELLSRPDFPRFHSLMPNPTDDALRLQARMIAQDLMWADPAESEVGLDDNGFGPNHCRGPSMIQFGSKAIDRFLQLSGCELIIRAHQVKQEGLRLSNQARVITVFTSSRYQDDNGAAAVFVAEGKLRFICCTADGAGASNQKQQQQQQQQQNAFAQAFGAVPIRV
eukprot:NODE_1839_length_1384_cov_25.649438_g1663_i0.p1 GENE.NODE_1839_length_1384_cov_25.649438_g1663_i0~~NODE_1839_length_1384_cov_25.649438_g1663_i0.p1  ORF type:complete len:435 (+),score=84.91 NODE_1839_length_1384_cov_25.649438_g1663_i0:165-1307(+)